MFEAALVAWAITAGVDWRMVALLCLGVWAPLVAGSALVLHYLRARPGPSMNSALFCQAVARDLRAGSGLRSSLRNAGAGVGAESLTRRLDDGEPIDAVCSTLRDEFPEIGMELESVVASVAASGAASASLFEELGDVALAQLEMTEEIRVATAPARASAFILIGLPTLFLGYQLFNGRFQDMLGRPLQQGLALVGATLAVAGIAVSTIIVRRSS